MLLTNNNDFILTIDGVKFSLKLTFKVLERIYNLINDSDLNLMFKLKAESPFDLIENVENKENITKTEAGFDVQDVIYIRLAGDVVC